jgi:hypothetical protein
LLESIAAPASKFVTKGRTFCHRCEKEKALAALPKEVVYNGVLVPVAKLPKPVALVVGLRARGEGKQEIAVDQQGDEHRWCPCCDYLMVWRRRPADEAAIPRRREIGPPHENHEACVAAGVCTHWSSPRTGPYRCECAICTELDKRFVEDVRDWDKDYGRVLDRPRSALMFWLVPTPRVGDNEKLDRPLSYLTPRFYRLPRTTTLNIELPDESGMWSTTALSQDEAIKLRSWSQWLALAEATAGTESEPRVLPSQWREPVYRIQSRRERIDRYLEAPNFDVRTLADFDDHIYCDETEISGGAFQSASTGSIVAHDYMHEQLMRSAKIFEYNPKIKGHKKVEEYFESRVIEPCQEPAPEKKIADMTEDEKRAERKKLLSVTGEIDGVKSGRYKEEDGEEGEFLSVDHIESGEKEFVESDGCFEAEDIHNPVFDDDEDSAGDGVLRDHIVDQRDTRPQNTVPSATKLLDHRDLEAIRALSRVKPPPFPLEIYNRYDEIRETAEKMNITENALQKRVTDYHQEALLMYDNKIPYNLVKTKHRLTEEQLQAVAEGKAHYILLEMNGEWVWRELDVAKHGTLDEAIEAFRQEVILKAFQRRPGGKKTCVDGAVATRDWNEVMAEYKEKFDRAFFLSTRPRWRGILGNVLAERRASEFRQVRRIPPYR